MQQLTRLIAWLKRKPVFYRTRSRIAALRAKWPPVPQSDHRYALTIRDNQIRELRRELTETKASMDRVLPKLVRLSMIHPTATDQRYRLVLDFDPFLIREAFMFGNDKGMIESFSERVGFMVRRELATMNMQRFQDPAFQPGAPRPFHGPQVNPFGDYL